jgi:hypothetical protein
MKYLLIALLFFSQLQTIAQEYSGEKIKIQWMDNLSGDFSFSKKWDYPEGIYKNEFGQLSCDGICPEEVYTMMDSTGKIYKDSLAAFYKIVDTTHQYHSIKADAWCYEYAGTDYIQCYETEGGLDCQTLNNAGTHSSLLFQFDYNHKYCYPSVILESINGNSIKFSCLSGSIKVDKKSWKKNTLKAVFDFKFKNTTDPSKPIYWKGKVLFKKI